VASPMNRGYNLGLLNYYLGKARQAEAAEHRAAGLEPENMDYLQALALQYLKQDNFIDAGRIADQMIAKHPEDRRGIEIKNFVQRNTK